MDHTLADRHSDGLGSPAGGPRADAQAFQYQHAPTLPAYAVVLAVVIRRVAYQGLLALASLSRLVAWDRYCLELTPCSSRV